MRILNITFENFQEKCKYHNKWFDYCNYRRGISEFGCYEYKCPFYHKVTMQKVEQLKAEGDLK